MPSRRTALPKLPKLLDRKLYKTGQTRGADDDVIYQNRVLRNSTVLIPFRSYAASAKLQQQQYERGAIVLLSPTEYRSMGATPVKREAELRNRGIPLGTRSLVFYQLRADYQSMPPQSLGWQPATQRCPPLGGQYVARIAGTTRQSDSRINLGFTKSRSKGAGIRVYEYASSTTIATCRIQLEALFWHAFDSVQVCESFGMTNADARERKQRIIDQADQQSLLDFSKLDAARIVNAQRHLVCPLCLRELSAKGFFTRLEQAEGREVHDLTVTGVTLFHIHELRVGEYNHRPYNLGWGCHFCNVVTKDAGISPTLEWMAQVLVRNGRIKS